MAKEKMNIQKTFPDYSYKSARLVYKGGAALSTGSTFDKLKKPEVAEYVAFTGDPTTDIKALAAKTHPDSVTKQAEYANKIDNALTQNLKGSKTDLWKYLVNQFCTAEAIVDGMLQFYTEDKEKKEYRVIKIGKYLKSIDDVSAVADADVINHTERLATYDRTKGDLKSLLAEIKAGNPVAFEKFGNKFS